MSNFFLVVYYKLWNNLHIYIQCIKSRSTLKAALNAYISLTQAFQLASTHISEEVSSDLPIDF